MQKFETSKDQNVIDKQLPHNFLAEKVILSCLLRNSEAVDRTVYQLPVEAFYFKNHQAIYRAIKFLHSQKTPIDIVILVTFLQDNGLLYESGGIQVLVELLNQLPNVVHLEEYLALVKEKYLRRCFIRLSYKTIDSSYITNITLETLLNNLEKELFHLTTTLKQKELSNNTELLDKIFLDLKNKSLNPTVPGILSDFHDLDLLTQGFQKSDLIIIAGRPSMGKTAFGMNIAVNVIKKLKVPVLFFSLEMSKEQIMYRLLSMEADISQMKLKTGNLNHLDWCKLTKLIKIFSKIPFFIDDSFNLSIQDIKLRIKSAIFQQKQIGLIIIDYLQLMQLQDSKINNRAQELSQITRSLKMLAREFNVPIIALSQLSRNIETRVDKKPMLSDLRDSGSIEQDADLVLFLSKTTQLVTSKNLETERVTPVELVIAKHRNGPIGTVKLHFDNKRTKFFNDFNLE